MRVTCSKCGKESDNEIQCSNCGYVFNGLKKLSFKERILSASPEQLKKVEIVGYIGNIIGTIVVIILFIFLAKSMWWVMFAFIFSIFIQVSQLISVLQQLRAMKQLNETFINMENSNLL